MSNYKTMAKRPNGKEFEPVTMLDNHFASHRYGVEFQDGKIYKESKCEIMKSQKEELEEELNDETKSPLDEFIEDRIKLLHIGFLGFPFSGYIDDFISETIRFAVQKHSEAVIPKKYILRNTIGAQVHDLQVMARNVCIDETQSASDKWRGV